MTVESKISEERAQQAHELLDKLKPEDRTNVERITSLLNELAELYDKELPRWDDRSAIFGVYLVGGWVNKEGQRPDVDVLVLTGVQWDRLGYVPVESHGDSNFMGKTNGDELVRILAEHFSDNGFDIELPEEIPNEYSVGAEPRVLIRLTPESGNAASPIDLVYISGGYTEPRIRSFEDFYERDANSDGSPLGRVALLETFVSKPPAPMRP